MEAIHFYPYGVAVAVAATFSLFWAQIRSFRSGIPSGAASWFGLLSVPLGFLLAFAFGLLRLHFDYCL